jgi:2Fe-2S ferredoxin
MPTIRFIQSNGTEQAVHGDIGQSVMQAAVNNAVPGILADCGGSCSCATCHCYVDQEWIARIPPAESYEVDMLSCALDVLPNSRLTCQINITPELDGIVLQIPHSQT